MKKIYLNYTCFIFLTSIKKMCSLIFSIHGILIVMKNQFPTITEVK